MNTSRATTKMTKSGSTPMSSEATPRRPMAPVARRRSLNDRLRNEAAQRGVSETFVRKQYIFAVFFGRIFRDTDSGWLLLGGNALLIRTGGGRFTQDIDLARSSDWDSIEELQTDLRHLADRKANDGFRFKVTSVADRSEPDQYGYGARTAKASVVSYLGAKVFEPFSIDISVRRHINGPVDHLQPRPVITDPALHDLPLVPTVPIENHLADKISALYEPHHSGVSNRYRDLADIVRIVKDLEFSAACLDEVLEHETQRRRIRRPERLVSPGPSWEHKYPAAAKDFAEFPAEFHALEASLSYAGHALNEVLARERTTGTWDPIRQAWN